MRFDYVCVYPYLPMVTNCITVLPNIKLHNLIIACCCLSTERWFEMAVFLVLNQILQRSRTSYLQMSCSRFIKQDCNVVVPVHRAVDNVYSTYRFITFPCNLFASCVKKQTQEMESEIFLCFSWVITDFLYASTNNRSIHHLLVCSQLINIYVRDK